MLMILLDAAVTGMYSVEPIVYPRLKSFKMRPVGFL